MQDLYQGLAFLKIGTTTPVLKEEGTIKCHDKITEYRSERTVHNTSDSPNFKCLLDTLSIPGAEPEFSYKL